MLSKVSAYKRDFDEAKYMCFLIKFNELLEKYNEMWDKVSKVIKKGFDSDPIYNENNLKIKKSCEGRINKNFQNDKITKTGFSLYLSISRINGLLCFQYG